MPSEELSGDEGSEEEGEMEKDRCTKGESSASTDSARRAVRERWGVGRGMDRVLESLMTLGKEEREGCRVGVRTVCRGRRLVWCCRLPLFAEESRC